MLDKYKDSKFKKELIEWINTIVVAIILFIFIYSFVVRTAYIEGISMAPTFAHGEKVLVTRFNYYFSNPKRGDIVAFPYSKEPKQFFIKRIIGLPGDEIDMRDYRFYVNGEILEDDFSEPIVQALGDYEYPIVVPENCYFVLGDNRNASMDSRYSSVGSINKKDIAGKISLRFWPINKFGIVK